MKIITAILALISFSLGPLFGSFYLDNACVVMSQKVEPHKVTVVWNQSNQYPMQINGVMDDDTVEINGSKQ